MKNYLDDVFYWLGALLITAGAFILYPPVALFSAGIFCLVFSFLIGKSRANSAQLSEENDRQ